MKKIQALLLAASVLFAASCQEEIASPEAENPEVGTSTLEVITITGTTQSETKTALDGLSTLWVEGDMISVFDANKDGNNRCFPVVEITNENKTATFSYEKGDFKMDHTQKDPTLVALYPYQESAYCDFFYYDRNYIKNLVVPAEQTAVANGFDANATFAIALGTMNTRESLNFQNLYSLLKFHVETPNVTSVTVTVGGENAYIAGDAKVQMQLNKELINNEEGEPVFFDPVLSALPDGGSKSVTLECEEGFSTDANVFYYIAVAPTTIESVQVAINETVVKSATKTMSFEANKIHSLGKLDYNRIDRELAFSDVPTTAVVGGDFDEPELTGTTDGVKYTSSNTDVATVDESTGEVTLVGVGETTITASAPKTDALLAGEANYTLTVTKASRTILFSEAPAEVTYGEDYAEPTLTVTPEASATYSVTKGAEAVTVDPSTGVVTINKAADVVEITATVDATECYAEATASYTFKVNKADRNLKFDDESVTKYLNDEFTISPLGVSDGVTYKSKNESVATVDNKGKVKVLAPGDTEIIVTAKETDTHNGGTASYKVTVPYAEWNLEGASIGIIHMQKSDVYTDLYVAKNVALGTSDKSFVFVNYNNSKKVGAYGAFATNVDTKDQINTWYVSDVASTHSANIYVSTAANYDIYFSPANNDFLIIKTGVEEEDSKWEIVGWINGKDSWSGNSGYVLKQNYVTTELYIEMALTSNDYFKILKNKNWTPGETGGWIGAPGNDGATKDYTIKDAASVTVSTYHSYDNHKAQFHMKNNGTYKIVVNVGNAYASATVKFTRIK